MKKIKNIEQLTDNKWLNLYSAHYEKGNGDDFVYYFASRRKDDDLIINGSQKLDAVRILPYYKKDGKTYIVLIKEFRHALNQYIYSTPAGLIDIGESPEQAAVREVAEEIGATVVNLELAQKGAFSSAGLTDEKIMVFNAEVVLDKHQKLEDSEDITFFSIPFKDILSFVDSNNFGMQSALHLKMFYYKNANEME